MNAPHNRHCTCDNCKRDRAYMAPVSSIPTESRTEGHIAFDDGTLIKFDLADVKDQIKSLPGGFTASLYACGGFVGMDSDKVKIVNNGQVTVNTDKAKFEVRDESGVLRAITSLPRTNFADYISGKSKHFEARDENGVVRVRVGELDSIGVDVINVSEEDEKLMSQAVSKRLRELTEKTSLNTGRLFDNSTDWAMSVMGIPASRPWTQDDYKGNPDAQVDDYLSRHDNPVRSNVTLATEHLSNLMHAKSREIERSGLSSVEIERKKMTLNLLHSNLLNLITTVERL